MASNGGRLPRAAADADQDRRVARDDALPNRPTADEGVSGPTKIDRRSWSGIVKRTAKQVGEDHLTTWAAALTYYAILSIFPGLLVLIAALRLTGQANTQKVLQNITTTAPGPARNILTSAVNNLQHGQTSTAGVLAIVGILGALWSASGYVSSFMQAANSIYDVP